VKILKQFFCQYQTLDNKGLVNCTYFDGSIGLCTFDNCPNKLWALRLILHHATNGGLRIKLRGLMAEMPFVKVIAHE
jgi:hypothetical protein